MYDAAATIRKERYGKRSDDDPYQQEKPPAVAEAGVKQDRFQREYSSHRERARIKIVFRKRVLESA